MKTKLLIICIMLSLSVLFACSPYDESDAKALIERRIPNCVNIVRVFDGGISPSYYVAVDNGYNVYYFEVNRGGEVEQKYPQKEKKNN